jgi:hypothetical protein
LVMLYARDTSRKLAEGTHDLEQYITILVIS